ncbi:aldehyde dehydrogenase family protein [Rhodococcus sp. ACT016]|uniref:aldehyde dehydrogenase family protein n=1 Tax=Rhodococcus sp. ACT016 TaxID=3134808 RepID=UPI003D2C552D
MDTTELISYNPATLVEVGRIAVTTTAELDSMIESAHDAFHGWRQDHDLRKGLLAACSYELMRKAEDIVPLLTTEQGKPRAEAASEVWIAAKSLAEAARTQWEPELLGAHTPVRTAFIERRPLGVVGAIVPWNFPVFLMAAKISAALAAGNTVIVKPAESVSLVVRKVVDVLAGVLPAGVISTAVGGPDVGRALMNHPKVRKVSFTGSTTVGKQIMRQAADTVTPVTLELGGNDPAILLADADIDRAATALAQGAFLNAGQICIAPKRVYAPTSLLDRFCRAFADRMDDLSVGDGLDPATRVGPLHNMRQLEIVSHLLEKAVAGGATVVRGGERGTDLPGHFLTPTLVRDIDDSAELVAVEQFGPVLPVVAYDDLDAVLSTLDDQEFGLGASVWGNDVENATDVALRIDAGTVWVNQHNALDVGLPFGGVKSSGFGREGGMQGIEDFLQTRVIDIKQ